MWPGEIQGGYPTQWALNPSAYQNLPNEQVDWATLAQQWIKMKETFPVDQVPPAPPPPSIKPDIEAGEAPMDMSKDDVMPNTPSTGTPQDGSNWGSWNNWQQWGGWNWGGPHGTAGAPPMHPEKSTSLPPFTYSASNAPSFPAADTPTTFDYNHGVSVPDSFDQQEYWSGNQAPFVRNKNSDWRGEQRGTTLRRPVPKVEEVVEPDTTTLFDAAKRKQLPAWIREGLEKMEREKQKKMERERMLKEREEEMIRRKQEEEEALASGIPLKSKFDTDSEESEKEMVEEMTVKSKKSRFDATSPVPMKPLVTKSSPPPVLPVKRKSRDEMMQEIMQQVRYNLTNILMRVTNEEMRKIAEEELADYRTKAPATQLRKTPAFTSLTGKLGLGIYDSDSEDSTAESDNEKPVLKQQNGVDTDEELRKRIHRKKQEFARIERDIEYQVELQEEKEREREQRAQESEEEPEENVDKGQVEPKLPQPGVRPDLKIEEPKAVNEIKHEENHTEFFTPERPYKAEKESSVEQTEDTDQSSSKSDSSSRSSSSTRYKKSRKSSKRRKEKKSSKRKRKRSSSRGSDRKKSSHRRSSHRYDERHRYERSRSRSRSRSHGHYDEYRHKRRHSSESSHHRRSRHHSYSRSPDYSRGKKSSHRSRD